MSANVLVRVYIHDGGGARIGELISVKDVSRAYSINAQVDSASFTIADNDPLASQLNPAQGHAIVIESTAYPLSWVGKIAKVRATRASGEINVTVASIETILEERTLGDQVVLAQQAGEAVRDLLAITNERNQTGIRVGSLGASTRVFTGTLYRMTAFAAISSIARDTGSEWWVDTSTDPSSIRLRLSMSEFRGEDAYSRIALVDGGSGAGQAGNASWTDWSIDGLGSTFGQGLVGGRAHAVQPPNATARADTDLSTVTAVAPHGYPAETGIDAPTVLTRREVLAFADELRDQDRLEEAAALMLGRLPGGTYRAVTIRVLNDYPTWAGVLPGNVLRFVAPDVFGTGYNGPVRVLKVQPDEPSGELGVVVQILRPKVANPTQAQV